MVKPRHDWLPTIACSQTLEFACLYTSLVSAVGELFADIGAEITHIKNKVEELTAERAASQPISPEDSIASGIAGEEKGGAGLKSEILEAFAPQDTELQKKCPMCGGRMNFQINEKMWQCYSCAYEKSENDEVQGKSEEEREHADIPEPAPASKPRSGPSPRRAVHLESLSSDEEQESKEESSPSNYQPSSKKKTCPVCRKKMSWHQTEKAWRCPHCQYERSI